MSLQIAAVYAILVISLVLFITEKIRVDLIGLLVLSALALLNLVTPSQAFSGFSNPAVITVWAMFIVSQGLTRTGIATIISGYMMRLAGTGEVALITVIMLIAAAMSAFMNNIGVAALLLPVVIEISRKTGVSPSRLLLPLAMGSLLGGLTTLVGTPPNLLVSAALAKNGFETFGLFDFMPIGGTIVVAGIGFFILFGRRLLPSRSPTDEIKHRSTAGLQSRYGLKERTFVLTIPPGSVLDGKTIAQSRLTSIAGLKVVAVTRYNRTRMLPPSDFELRSGQQLLAQGRVDRLRALKNWNELIISRERSVLWDLLSDDVLLFEVQVAPGSSLEGRCLEHSEFHGQYKGNVLAVRRAGQIYRSRLAEFALTAGDRLVVQGVEETVNRLEHSGDFDDCFQVSESDLIMKDRIMDDIFVLRVPESSVFVDRPLYESGIGDLFDFRLLGLIRGAKLNLFPTREEAIKAEDRLLIQGSLEQIDVLRGFQELVVEDQAPPDLDVLAGEKIALMEAMLAPRGTLAGKTVADIRFPEKYGLELMAVWREDRAYRSNLENMTLNLGDAFLLMGPRNKLALLQNDDEFLVLTPISSTEENTSKAGIAALILALFVAAILTGWLPVEVAAVIAASIMLLTGCLTMDEAYRAIEWRSIFLIAGMLPLGIALDQSGAAALAANQIMAGLGDAGPWAVIFGFYLITAVATLFIPTAALVVLMAPIVLTASAGMGIAPQPGMMAVAIAASASFASPVSHPANLLVMGPGGYRFVDYLKVGIPLTMVVFVVTLILLPIVYPLTPV
jgi:di/tricarboxylate transporter